MTVAVASLHHIHKFVSGREAEVIKAFDKKGPNAGKFSVKYKDDPTWWTHSLMREGYGKDKHWVLLGSRAVIPLEVTYDCSRRRPDFLFCCFIEVTYECSEVC